MNYVLLTWLADRLADWPAETVYWTRFYWHHRLRRMHERLEHDGQPCPNDYETDFPLLDDGCSLDVNWDKMEPLQGRAITDADTALGPGPFQRPDFACGDIRPIDPGKPQSP